MKKKYAYSIFLLIIILLIAGYFLLRLLKKPIEWTAQNSLSPVSAPGIADHRDVDSLIRSIDSSLRYFDRDQTDPEKLISFGKEKISSLHIKESLLDFKAKLMEYGLTERFFRYVKQNYRFYRSAAKEVLFTGYYEADLKGSLKPSKTFHFPLYRKPDDLYRVELFQFPFFDRHKGLPMILRGRLSQDNRILPYYTREEIDYQQKLAGKNLEIAWVDNPVDVFFLHIQGSGIVELDTGETLRVNYAESNGHSYRAIGRLLIEQGILTRENISMQGIRDYLDKHPGKMQEIFIYNPSYVFFRVVEEGPMGAIDVPLTPFRSIATDKYLFPKGALCYIETELPVFDEGKKVKEWKRFSGFVLNQDTGGAIRTPRRADLFTGYGEQSKLTAGHMKQKGTFYFLIYIKK